MDGSLYEKGVRYSADEQIKISHLKSGEYKKPHETKHAEDLITQYNIQRCVADESDYHFKFLRVPAKPYIVYFIGNADLLNKDILSIVGPRKASPYACSVMKDLFQYIPRYDLVTISGGAPGIDTLCHKYSLEHTIPTIMVLGGGLGRYLQSRYREFIHTVVDNGGLILSEFKLFQEPTNYTFPQRNRIVAGLGDAVFVPAAGEKSGSLITVDFALQIGTPVYTVPASIYEATSKGTNQYLADAKIATIVDYEQMLDAYFGTKHEGQRGKEVNIHLSKQQQRILIRLQEHGKMHIASLSSALDLSISQVLSELTVLELENLVEQAHPGIYHAI